MSVYGDKKKGTRILSWRVACYYTDWTGERKKHEKRGFATKAEAKEYEHEFLAKKSRDIKMEFSTFLDQYLEDLKPRIKMSTMETKISQIDKHIRPFFGKRCLSEINSTIFSSGRMLCCLSGTKTERGIRPHIFGRFRISLRRHLITRSGTMIFRRTLVQRMERWEKKRTVKCFTGQKRSI